MKEKEIYSLSFGDFSLRYSFNYPGTFRFFDGYLQKCIDQSEDYDICITPEYMKEHRWLVGENHVSLSCLEYQTLMLATGNVLLLGNRALLHGAALLWRNYVWIFSAPSGIGKTTQLMHWKQLFKDDVLIINGDKPLLECREDGTIKVYSSPWRGKERYGQPHQGARLGGIVLLKQGEENRIARIKSGNAVTPLFKAFISSSENIEQIRSQAKILEQVLNAVPVWELTNRGDEASAYLTKETLASYLEEEQCQDG